MACDDCGKTTYRKEVGVGYVFRYDTINNISYPVEGSTVTVESFYETYGLYGKKYSPSAEKTYTEVFDSIYRHTL